MRRRVLLLVVAGLLGWLGGLVATLPAARALAWFGPPGIDAAGVSGSVWQGHADRIDAGGARVLTAVDWDLAVSKLLTGRVAADARFAIAGIEGKGRLARGIRGRVEVQDLALSGPVDGAVRLLPGTAIDAGGRLLARIAELELAQGRIDALRARMQWSDAALRSPIPLDLGNVRVEIGPADGRPGYRVDIEGTGGGLDIAGGATLDPDGRYSADLRFTPTAAAPDGLRETLGMALPRDGNGFRLRRDGRLPGIGGG